jgi:hypothetical protein
MCCIDTWCKSIRFVILSAAKNLSLARERFFAALRMTVADVALPRSPSLSVPLRGKLMGQVEILHVIGDARLDHGALEPLVE